MCCCPFFPRRGKPHERSVAPIVGGNTAKIREAFLSAVSLLVLESHQSLGQ